jgi:TolB-like protein
LVETPAEGAVHSRITYALGKLVRTATKSRTRLVLSLIVALLVTSAAVVGGNALFRFATTPPVSVSEKSVAVLPFESLSDNKSDTYFADGVQDEILSNLAKVSELKVISRTSVMSFRAGTNRNLRSIAEALGVAHVVEGTVRRQGNRCRVTTTLVDARTDQTLWSETYDRDISDIFAIQSEIAQTAATKLQARLSREEQRGIEEKPTSNLEAYELYLQAKHSVGQLYRQYHGSQEAFLQAVRLLEEATRQDSKFALAYCLMGRAHDSLYHFEYDRTPERRALGETAVNEALRLRPDLPEAHLAAAYHFYWGYRDYQRARVHVAATLRALPNNPEALALVGNMDRRQLGDWESSIRSLEKAVSLDPKNPRFLTELGSSNYHLRQYHAYEEIYDRIIQLEPDQPLPKIRKTFAAVSGKADLAPFQRALASLPSSILDDMDVTAFRIYAAMLARDWQAATRIVRDTPHEYLRFIRARLPAGPGGAIVPRGCWEILIKRFEEGRPTDEVEILRARDQLSRTAEEYPEQLSVLAVIDAAIGQKEMAIREARRAVELLPVSQDAFIGPALLVNLATVYALTNESDLAFQVLVASARTPSGVNYGHLMLDPGWDAIRQDPRFEKLVAELAPRD